jgi:hypothetical protein
VLFQPIALRLLEIASIYKHNICGSQRWAKLQPALLLIARELGNRFANAAELLGRGEAVRTLSQDTLSLLAFEPRNPHHKKFVEIIRGYRKEPDTFEQRMVLISRLFQDAPIKMEPRQLAIYEPLGARSQIGNRRGGSRFSEFGPIVVLGGFLN